MKLVVFGSTGATGRQLVAQALAAGHEVTAFARDPLAIAQAHPKLRVATGNVLDPATLGPAIAGQESVLVALGHSQGKRSIPTLLTDGTRNIIAAMKQHGVRRLIVESSAGVLRSGPWGFNLFGPLLFKAAYADKATQEPLIQDSGLDWTIVKPTKLVDGPARGRVQASDQGRAPWRISFADTAAFMLQQVTSDAWLKKSPVIGG